LTPPGIAAARCHANAKHAARRARAVHGLITT